MAGTRLNNMKKKEFEQLLYTLNNRKSIGHRKLDTKYIDPPTILHLYYGGDDDAHIGTWQRGGRCCVFEEHLPSTSIDGKTIDGRVLPTAKEHDNG